MKILIQIIGIEIFMFGVIIWYKVGFILTDASNNMLEKDSGYPILIMAIGTATFVYGLFE